MRKKSSDSAWFLQQLASAGKDMSKIDQLDSAGSSRVNNTSSSNNNNSLSSSRGAAATSAAVVVVCQEVFDEKSQPSTEGRLIINADINNK